MSKKPAHLLIQGDFAPTRKSRLLRMAARILSLLLFVFLVGTLGVYGVKVHLEDNINQVARDTRELNEQNKDLQVHLNHIRSFKNVEAAASKVPHLHMAETVIEVPVATGQQKLAPMPKPAREFPQVYGY